MPKKMEYEELVEAVRKVGEAAENMKQSGCTRRLIVTLLHDKTKISKKMIGEVLDGLEGLVETYLEDEDGE